MTSLPADPIAAVVHPDPYPYYAGLRATDGAGWHEDLGMWVVADDRGVTQALHDVDCRVRPIGQPVPAALVGTPAGDLFAQLARTTDGERHDQARAAAMRALPVRDVSRLVEKQAADLARRSSLDHLLSEIAVRVLAGLLGVPDGDLDATFDRTMALVRGFRPTATAGDGDAASAAAATFGTLERAAIGLLIQSAEATAALIGNSVVALTRDTSLVENAASPPGALDLVLRTLRQDPPVHNTRRFVAVDHVVAGRPMKTGDQILVVLAAGAEPFGSGRHSCPGSSLASTLAAAVVAWLAGNGRALVEEATFSGYRRSVNVRMPMFTIGS